MTWSIQVANGDISYGSNGLNTVGGGAKLVQDLGCCILEPMGTDPLHPSFGSIIDGGVDANGTPQQGVIGGPNNNITASFVSAEIQRICQNYQIQQVARNNADLATYGKSTLTADECLLSVESVDIQLVQDAMLVSAALSTGGGSTSLVTLVGS